MFFISLVPYIHICLYYFLILCSYFHLLFLTLLATRHILQFTIFDSISLQPARNITEIKLHSPRRKKKCRVNYNQNNYSNLIFGLNYELFLPLYQITFFLGFGQAKIFFSYHILMNILIYIHIILCQKNLLTIFHTEKHFKIRKEHVLIKCLVTFYTARIWQNLITSKVFRASKKSSVWICFTK